MPHTNKNDLEYKKKDQNAHVNNMKQSSDRADKEVGKEAGESLWGKASIFERFLMCFPVTAPFYWAFRGIQALSSSSAEKNAKTNYEGKEKVEPTYIDKINIKSLGLEPRSEQIIPEIPKDKVPETFDQGKSEHIDKINIKSLGLEPRSEQIVPGYEVPETPETFDPEAQKRIDERKIKEGRITLEEVFEGLQKDPEGLKERLVATILRDFNEERFKKTMDILDKTDKLILEKRKEAYEKGKYDDLNNLNEDYEKNFNLKKSLKELTEKYALNKYGTVPSSVYKFPINKGEDDLRFISFSSYHKNRLSENHRKVTNLIFNNKLKPIKEVDGEVSNSVSMRESNKSNNKLLSSEKEIMKKINGMNNKFDPQIKPDAVGFAKGK